MNKNLHRIVFNKSRGLRMAVAETASSCGKGRNASSSPAGRVLALAALALFTATQAQIVADPSAPGQQRPTVLAAPNGVPLVNIQTPSAAGVSRNTYSQFDVQRPGAILNNSRSNVQTQLGGFVQGNPWLAAGSAKVILNEVNSSNPSVLKGHVEVAGQKADVIIANPSGIKVDGAGFINAGNVVLTTGVPILSAQGSLDSYRVQRGTVVIEGLGLDTRTASHTDILARAIEVNAGLWADYLRLAAGAGQVNAADPASATPLAGAGAKPTFMLDVAAIGGLYANHIYLVGSESGLGVSNHGVIGAGAGDVVLLTDGTLTNRGSIQAKAGVRINATGGIVNSGPSAVISAQDGVSLSTGGAIANTAGATLAATGALSANATGAILSSQATLAANGAVTLNAASLTNEAGTIASVNDRVAITTTGATSNTQGARISATGDLSLTNAGLTNTTGTLSGNNINIATANQLFNNAGGTAIAGQSAAITAASLTGNGKLLSQGDLSLTLATDYTNTGELAANGHVTLYTSANLANSGKLQAGNTLSVSAANISNAATGEISAATTTLTASSTLTNRGLIDGQDTRINAATLSNIGTGRLYGNHLSIAAIQVNNDTENGKAATIAARTRLDIAAQTLSNRDHALIFSAGDMSLGGSLDANHQATGQADSISNASATIEALANLTIAAARISNTNSSFAMTAGPAQTEDRHEILLSYQSEHRPYSDTYIYQQRDADGNYFNATLASHVARTDGADIYVNMGNCWCNVAGPFTALWSEYQYQRTTTTDTVAASDPGKLLAGGNITLSGNLLNDKSQVIAGHALTLTGGTLSNIDAIGAQTTTDVGQTRTHDYVQGNHHGIDRWLPWAPYTPASVTTTVNVPVNAYLANTAPAGSGTTLAAASQVNVPAATSLPGANSAVIRTSPPNTQLPAASLFRLAPNPQSGYLIETDPRFAGYSQWLSSDYLLDSLGIKPAEIDKRLGDGFYEQKLVREQLAQLTGRRFTGDYTSDDEQYRALMESGATYAKAWNLRPGIALSAAQMAQLTSDIVWLVEQDVTLPDGTKTKALVPQVYVRVQDGDLDGSGTLLAGKSINLNLSGDLINNGTIAGRQIVSLTAENVQNLAGRIRGDAVSVTARQDLNNIGASIQAATSLNVAAGRDLNVLTTTQGGARSTGIAGYASQGIDRVAGLYVTGDKGLLVASAGRDVNLVAAQAINSGAGSATVIEAGRNLNLETVKTATSEQVTWNATNHRKDAISQDIGSQIAGAGSVQLTAGQDINAKAATVQAGGAMEVSAGRDIHLTAGEQATQKTHASQTTRKGFLSRTTTTSYDHVEQTTAVGSSVSGNTVSLKAGQDANLTGSQLTAQAELGIEAGRDIQLQSAHNTTYETHSSQSVKKASGLGQLLGVATLVVPAVGAALLTKTQNNQAGEQTSTQAVGSTLSAGSITTRSGRDTSAQGATIVADGDIDMKAGRDLKLESAQDTAGSASQSSSRKSGFIGSISQPAIGTIKQSQDETQTSTTQIGSTVASLNGNVTLKAEGAYTQTASKVLALGQDAGTGNVDIQGRQVIINEAYDTQTGTQHTQTSKTAIGGSVSVPLLDAAKALKNVAKAATETSDARIQALGMATAALQANALAGSAKAAIADGNVGGIKASISLGSSKSESTSEQSSSTVVGSQVTGNNAGIRATGEGKDSDLIVSGSDITGKDTASLKADGKVILQAATNTAQQHSTNNSSGWNVGLGFALGGTQNGFTLELGANKSRGNADGSDTTQANTHVSAGNQASIISGGDTSLRGAVVSAPTVKADVGGDLKIESLQDKSTYTEASKSASVGVSLCLPPFCVGASNASGSAGNTHIDSNYASVNEQSGIRAGDGGFQVDVKGSTDLKGGAITSTQKAVDDGKNSFNSANGVTTSDIQNSASYDAKGYSIGASIGSGVDPEGQSVPGGSAGIGKDTGNSTGTTQAAISGIAGNKNARTGDAETGIKPIFDQQKVADEVNAQVAITVEFGRQAPKAWADYAQTRLNDLKDQTRAAAQAGDKQGAKELFDEAKKWDEGGEYRIAGHTLLGALAGGLGGAAGALASTAVMPEIGKLIDGTDLPEAVKQGLGMVASATLGAIFGGTAGAASSFNVDTNNRQLHPTELKWISDNRKRFALQLSERLGHVVSEIEAMYWLTAAGESNVDAAMQRSNAQFIRGTNNTEDAQAYDTAKSFIAANTRTGGNFTDERGQTQSLFSARNGEFYKPEVYGVWKNDANYRDYYWTVMGINLRGDAMSAQEQALYEQREKIVREQQLKQLAILAVQAAAGKVASNVAARAGQPAAPGQTRLTAEEAAAIELARIENNINADLPNVYTRQGGGRPLGKPTQSYDMTSNSGPLGKDLASTFAGGRYTEILLQEDTVLYRAGIAARPYGQFFSQEPLDGVIQTRVDKAVLPKWPGGGESPIDSIISIKVPAGTKVYVGEVGSQGGFYVGGTPQIVVPLAWEIPGIKVMEIREIK